MSSQRKAIAEEQNRESDPAPPKDPTVVTVDVEDEDKLAGLLESARPGERIDKRKSRTRESGRVDLTPDITTESIDSLERKRQRELLATITPSTREPPGTTAFREASEARRQAEQLEATLAEQAAIAAQNISDAQAQIDLLEDNPSGYTIDGEPVTRSVIVGLKQNLEDYKKGFLDYVEAVSEQTTGQREYANATMRAIGEWSKKVVDRGKDVKRQEQRFDSQLQTNIGFGSFGESATRERSVLGKITQGIPGPGLGSAPGSFGEKLQNTFGVPASKAVKGSFAQIERPFTAITQPLRDLGGKLGEESAQEPASYAGLAKWSASIGLNIIAGTVDVATIGLRPGLIVKQIETAGALAFNPSARKQVVETIKKDPVRFIAETGGSAAFGAKLAQFGSTLARQAGPVYRTVRAGGTPRQALAVAQRQTARVDFDQLLRAETELYGFPSEAIQPEFLQTFGPETIYEAPETFSFKPFKKSTFGTKPLFKPVTAGQIFAPEGVVTPSTIFRFRETLLNIPSGTPRIPITTSPPSIALTRGINLIDVLSGAGIALGSRSLLRQRTPQVQRPGTVQQNIQAFNTNLTKNINKSITFTGQLPALNLGEVQKQPQIQRQRSLQVPRLITTTEIDFEKKLRTFFSIQPPKIPRKKTIIGEVKKKKKKKDKKRKGIRDILEFRVDPLKGIKIGRRKQ